MKKSLEEHADRFSEIADDYDESQQSEEYLACANLVIELADPGPEDVVLDLGCGTGAIALALAPDAGRVVGRDISEGMLERARKKAAEGGIDDSAESRGDAAGSRTDGSANVEFGEGRFRDPNYDGPVDVVTSNFAMHHLSDAEKREAIEAIAALGPRRFVLGDVMFFGEPDPSEPFFDPAVDDPATVGVLADALTDAGFALTAVERVHEQVGVLVAERAGARDATDAAIPAGSDAAVDGTDAERAIDADAGDEPTAEAVDGDDADGADDTEVDADVHSDAPGAPDPDDAAR
jgi:SAM-dependent methyltransferase